MQWMNQNSGAVQAIMAIVIAKLWTCCKNKPEGNRGLAQNTHAKRECFGRLA